MSEGQEERQGGIFDLGGSMLREAALGVLVEVERAERAASSLHHRLKKAFTGLGTAFYGNEKSARRATAEENRRRSRSGQKQ